MNYDAVSSIAHLNCGQCQTVLMYPYGAPSVKCAICNFITNTGVRLFLFTGYLCWKCYKCSSTLIDFKLFLILRWIQWDICHQMELHILPHQPLLYVQLFIPWVLLGIHIGDFHLLITSFFPCRWQPTTQSQNVTVVVENPMTVDAKGKLVSHLLIAISCQPCLRAYF